MVGAAMAEGELVGLVPGREAEELMTEADPEDGDAAQELAHGVDLRVEGLRVPGPVREEDAVELRELVGRGGVRDDRHGRSRLREPAEDRALRAVVDHGDVR